MISKAEHNQMCYEQQMTSWQSIVVRVRYMIYLKSAFWLAHCVCKSQQKSFQAAVS